VSNTGLVHITGVGSCIVVASQAGNTNYVAAPDKEHTITIYHGTTTVTCGAGPFTYTGSAITPCSASVTGLGGFNQSLTVSYHNNSNAGTATANASHSPTRRSKTGLPVR
jgi:hypothetical protein